MASALSNDHQSQRQQVADIALADYHFGDDITINDTGQWNTNTNNPNRLSCRLYAEDNELHPMYLLFCIDFTEGEAQPISVIAVDFDSGSGIGTAG